MGKRLAKFIFRFLVGFVVVSVLWVLLYKYVPVPYTGLMAIRGAEGAPNYERKHQWVDFEHISEEIKLAIICAEDQQFMTHNGFDYEAIEKAYEQNKAGKRIRGGSTISQQTAKNV
ncbi:MAG: transglycosylase domain-containing protein, partial [Bacteroidota bacterium]